MFAFLIIDNDNIYMHNNIFNLKKYIINFVSHFYCIQLLKIDKLVLFMKYIYFYKVKLRV